LQPANHGPVGCIRESLRAGAGRIRPAELGVDRTMPDAASVRVGRGTGPALRVAVTIADKAPAGACVIGRGAALAGIRVFSGDLETAAVLAAAAIPDAALAPALRIGAVEGKSRSRRCRRSRRPQPAGEGSQRPPVRPGSRGGRPSPKRCPRGRRSRPGAGRRLSVLCRPERSVGRRARPSAGLRRGLDDLGMMCLSDFE
jgi:hypothetical protein